MQAVILAAGRGTRMKELTEEIPKPLLQVHGVTLLHHKLAELPESVDEVIFVIGYQGERIRAEFGEHYEGKSIKYVTQDTLNGTAGAVWRTKELITGRFLILMGDDLYGREDLLAAAEMPDWVIGVQELGHMRSGGKVITDVSNNVMEIKEGNHEGQQGMVSTNLFALDARVFGYPMISAGNGKQEFGLPQTVLAASKSSKIPLHALKATFWFQITAPEDLGRAGEVLRARGVE